MDPFKQTPDQAPVSGRKMLIGLHLGNGYGSQPGAWRMPWVDPKSYTSFDARVKQAQAAERGKFQFLFLPDGPGAVMTDIATESPAFNLDVMMTLPPNSGRSAR